MWTSVFPCEHEEGTLTGSVTFNLLGTKESPWVLLDSHEIRDRPPENWGRDNSEFLGLSEMPGRWRISECSFGPDSPTAVLSHSFKPLSSPSEAFPSNVLKAPFPPA